MLVAVSLGVGGRGWMLFAGLTSCCPFLSPPAQGRGLCFVPPSFAGTVCTGGLGRGGLRGAPPTSSSRQSAFLHPLPHVFFFMLKNNKVNNKMCMCRKEQPPGAWGRGQGRTGGGACAGGRWEGGSAAGAGAGAGRGGGHGRGRLGPAALGRIHPHRAPRRRHLRHRLQGLQEGRAGPAAATPLPQHLHICPPLLPAPPPWDPAFRSLPCGASPSSPYRGPITPLPGAPSARGAPGRPGKAPRGGCSGGGYGGAAGLAPLGRGTRARWWPSSA